MTTIERLRIIYLEKKQKAMKLDVKDLKDRMKKLELQVRGEQCGCGRVRDFKRT